MNGKMAACLERIDIIVTCVTTVFPKPNTIIIVSPTAIGQTVISIRDTDNSCAVHENEKGCLTNVRQLLRLYQSISVMVSAYRNLSASLALYIIPAGHLVAEVAEVDEVPVLLGQVVTHRRVGIAL